MSPYTRGKLMLGLYTGTFLVGEVPLCLHSARDTLRPITLPT